MRVILAGQRSFGVAVYDMLLEEGHDVACVWAPYTEPRLVDKDKLASTALDRGTLDPIMYRNPKRVQELEVDLFVAAHSHDFIGRDSRAATRLGGIGYHPSLLPRHRGRDSVRWTCHMGDPITGGSVYWLTDSVDGGPIANQDWCFVPSGARPLGPVQEDDVVSWLWRERLFPMGVELLRQTLRDLDLGMIFERPQDEAYATWEPSWSRPPLHRPELPQIGSRNGMQHVASPRR